MYKIITEGKARIKVPKEEKVSKKLPVFYNPIMKFNRDITVALLNSINRISVKDKEMTVALPLSGTGIRGIRILKECKNIKKIYMNDFNVKAVKLMLQNIELNNIKAHVVHISHNDANAFLEQYRGFDYIDIDPYGPPTPFLDSAIRHLSRGGVLGVTATDTGALSGTYVKACLRKYNSRPLLIPQMHELGLRILIRKVQEVGCVHEKALVPIYSYSKEHYMRAFFKCEKGKQKCDKIIDKHKFFNYNPNTLEYSISKLNSKIYAGPLWTGQLKDKRIAKAIAKKISIINNKENIKFTQLITDELDIVGFYDLHAIAKKYKLQIPKFDDLSKRITLTRTHFSPYGIKCKLGLKELIEKL